MERRPVLLGWQLADSFGWGIVGLNLFRQWVLSGDVAPMMQVPIPGPLPDTPPEQAGLFQAAIAFSNSLANKVAQGQGAAGQGAMGRIPVPVVHALGNQFNSATRLTGPRNIGRVVFEDTNIAPLMEKLAVFDSLVCACEWNAGLLRAHTTKPIHVIHEAIDHGLFHPGPRTGLLPPDRFYIFSGGKIEFRKAQDLVLLAFREFSRRHDDAVLVTAWHSHWPAMSLGYRGRLDAPLRLAANGRLDIHAWAAGNGVDPAKVMDLGLFSNREAPAFLRHMDCALQPSRAEAATNLVATEAMSCAVPVILGRNTGMLDMIAGDNCVALERQGPVTGPPEAGGTQGWGESDVDEIVEALEMLYADKAARRRIGAQGNAFMKTRTWPAHAAALKAVIFP